jgi:uncharacterized protein (DUF2141 family)
MDSNEGYYWVRFVSIDLSGDVHADKEEAGIPREHLVVVDQTPEKILSNPKIAQESKFVKYRNRQKSSKVQNAS